MFSSRAAEASSMAAAWSWDIFDILLLIDAMSSEDLESFSMWFPRVDIMVHWVVRISDMAAIMTPTSSWLVWSTVTVRSPQLILVAISFALSMGLMMIVVSSRYRIPVTTIPMTAISMSDAKIINLSGSPRKSL